MAGGQSIPVKRDSHDFEGASGLFLPAGRSFLGLFSFYLPRIAFTNSRCFSSQAAKVIEFGAPDPALLHHIDMIDDGRVQGENSFHSDAETRFPDSDRFARAAMFARNHHAFECLQAFLGFRFLNPNVNSNRITRLEIRDVVAQLRRF